MKKTETFAPGCVIKSLPKNKLIKAARNATEINPVNAPPVGLPGTGRLRIAVATQKYWGPRPRKLSVSFMESTPRDLRARIIAHLNAWTRKGGISFHGTSGTGEVRISRGGGGYWSYLGTDIQLIASDEPTMNLEGFTMGTSESEFRRVVRHEAGHTLGFPHEHMRSALVSRIDPQKAYRWFRAMYGWDRQTVDEQVLTPLSQASLMGTPADQTSIMCYQLPGLITKDGQPILGGTNINQTDHSFCGSIYPKPSARGR